MASSSTFSAINFFVAFWISACFCSRLLGVFFFTMALRLDETSKSEGVKFMWTTLKVPSFWYVSTWATYDQDGVEKFWRINAPVLENPRLQSTRKATRTLRNLLPISMQLALIVFFRTVCSVCSETDFFRSWRPRGRGGRSQGCNLRAWVQTSF